MYIDLKDEHNLKNHCFLSLAVSLPYFKNQMYLNHVLLFVDCILCFYFTKYSQSIPVYNLW